MQGVRWLDLTPISEPARLLRPGGIGPLGDHDRRHANRSQPRWRYPTPLGAAAALHAETGGLET
jgi:hypothetical protein